MQVENLRESIKLVMRKTSCQISTGSNKKWNSIHSHMKSQENAYCMNETKLMVRYTICSGLILLEKMSSKSTKTFTIYVEKHMDFPRPAQKLILLCPSLLRTANQQSKLTISIGQQRSPIVAATLDESTSNAAF